MYLEYPFHETPKDKDAKIWRYMDIPKFLSLIGTRSLYFARSDFLGDRFEGSIPSSDEQKELNKKSFYNLLDQTERLVNNDPINPNQHSFKEFFQKHIPDFQPPYQKELPFKKWFFVCCFNMNEFESAALWSIYTKEKQGIAIQTTFSRLCNCFNDYKQDDIQIGLVKYIDYSSQTIGSGFPPPHDNMVNPILRFFHKRKSFEHERELRAMVMLPKKVFLYDSGLQLNKELFDQIPGGLTIPVDLEVLIEKIYIAPESPPWIKDLLTSVLKKYEIDRIPQQSNLDIDPVF